MRMNIRRLAVALLTVFMLLPFSLAVSGADGALLIDSAGLLSESQASDISSRLDRLSSASGLDIAIITVDSLGGRSIVSYADDLYDYGGYAPDGMLFLISMSEREFHFSTVGYGATVFTDYGLSLLESEMLSYLSSGDYYTAFKNYAVYSESLIESAERGAPVDIYDGYASPGMGIGGRIMLSLLIGFVLALITTGTMRSELKSVRAKNAAEDYAVSGSMKLTDKRDIFLYNNVSRVARPRDNGGHGGSGGHGGGSTTHRSSSGRSHGGRSGRF